MFLDGVRGLAAVWVFLSHAWGTCFTVIPGAAGLLTNWMVYSHFAVDAFIVFSGYCLSLAAARPALFTAGGVARFYRRRIVRIAPPLYASIGLGALVAVASTRFGTHGVHLSPTLVLANGLLLQDVFPADNTLNPPVWSVALELKIYLLFPMLIWLCRFKGTVTAIVVSATVGYGLTLAAWAVSPGEDLTYTCPWYVLVFTIGIVASESAQRTRRSRHLGRTAGTTGAFALAASVVLVELCPIHADNHDSFASVLPWLDVAVGTLVASGLILIGDNKLPTLRRLLEKRLLVTVGTASYSLYLVHFPVLMVCQALLNRLPGQAYAAKGVQII